MHDSFEIFEPFSDFLQTIQVILNTEDIAKARETFQNYWLSKSIQF
jgi:hypothetical protein